MKFQVVARHKRTEGIFKAIFNKAEELRKCPTSKPNTFVVHLNSLVRVYKIENPKTQSYPISIELIDDEVKVKWEKKTLIKITPCC